MAALVQERVMFMPHSSNPLNDHAVMSSYVPELEGASQPASTRESLGLPADAVILANFNNPYKLDAAGARAWAAALKGAGQGAIWMPEWEGLQSTGEVLRQLMLQEGVTWDAVVTTPLLPRENHLLGRQLSDVRPPCACLRFVRSRRMRASKLCHSIARVFSPCVLFYCLQAALDTIAFNGHGTAAESLWAAIPVVTLPGDSICNRVGAAVSLAAGQSALIARNLEEYILLIRRLLLRPRLARVLKQQLREQRGTAPLWDIKRLVGAALPQLVSCAACRYTRHWERSMRMAWEAPLHHVIVAV